MSLTHIIGIDPGANVGFAVLDIEARTLTISPSKFWKVIKTLPDYDPRTTVIVVENPNQLSPTIRSRYESKKYHGQLAAGRKNPTGYMGPGEMDRISQSVGMNKREAQLYLEFAKNNGYTTIEYYPHHRKLTMEQLDQLANQVGYTLINKTIQQHGIDAGVCVLMRYSDKLIQGRLQNARSV